MPSSPIAVVLDDLADQLPTTDDSLSLFTDGDRRTLAEALAAVPDPRRRRGVRYRFTPLLSAAVCAMLCGARSVAAIVEWIADLSGPARVDLALTGKLPAGTTLWRLLVAVDPVALQSVLGAWLRTCLRQRTDRRAGRRRRRRVLAVDGKTMRATLQGGEPVHLLGVLDHYPTATPTKLGAYRPHRM